MTSRVVALVVFVLCISVPMHHAKLLEGADFQWQGQLDAIRRHIEKYPKFNLYEVLCTEGLLVVFLGFLTR